MSYRFISCCVAALMLCLSSVGVGFASEDGQIMGFIVDSAGRPVPNVTVKVVGGENERTATSDRKGEFVLRDLSSDVPLTVLWDEGKGSSGKVEGVRVPPGGTLFVMTGYLSGEVGETLAFRIPSNPTTGYSWAISDEGTPSVAVPVGNLMESRDEGKDPRGNVGAGGNELWLFRCVGPGNSSVGLSYVRSWETDVQPSRVAVAILSVR